MIDEESQVYFIDSDQLPPEVLERKHQLENDSSVRSDHMKYMAGMEILDSDIKDIVLREFAAYDYDKYTAGLVPDPDAAEFFASIDEHKACISEARSEIERIKAENEAAKAAAGAVICPSCGFANSHGTKFCQECGTKIESYTAVKVCPSCGAELSDNVKFCSNCGTKIE